MNFRLVFLCTAIALSAVPSASLLGQVPRADSSRRLEDRGAIRRPPDDSPALPAFIAARGVPATADSIRQRLEGQSGRLIEFYEARRHEPVWTPQLIHAFDRFLTRLYYHGLHSSLFQIDQWRQTWSTPARSEKEATETEVKTTHLAVYAIQSLAYGFVDPTTVHPKWARYARGASPYTMLDSALKQGAERFADALETAASPRDVRYRDLVQTLAKYREIAAQGGWRPIPAPPKPVSPGESYSDVPLLRARLRMEGDLLPNAAQFRSKIVDPETAGALKSFQFRHGIDPDGVLGPQTVAELNHSVEYRVQSLIINLDRLRWMPRAYEETEHLEVNIAESALRMFSGGQSAGTMRVIVGIKGEHQTPVFHGDIQYLIYRPYWNVPPKIAREEVIPKALDDPGFVARDNYEIVKAFGVPSNEKLPVTVENLKKVASGQLQIRQGTGDKNALGLVKFIFPNDSSVYLHDTPSRHLFSRTDRDFSHGCVRVSQPGRLANFVLQPNGDWPLDRIEEAMNDATQPSRRVNLARKIPVYLVYWTSTIMDDGRVRFDQDIYGHDAEMRHLLGLEIAARAVPVTPRQ